jgi:hypothetical protein
MAEQAQVKSVDALQSLRNAVVIYQTKAKRAVDMALDDVVRTRQWILGDRRLHWEGQIRQIGRVLERAKAELMTVRLSAMVDRSFRHEEAVRRAERDLAHAQDKLKQVKRWARDFENAVGPHVRRLESVRDHFQQDLPKAIAWLHQAQVTLEAYAESRSNASAAPPADNRAPEAGPAAPDETQNPADA